MSAVAKALPVLVHTSRLLLPNLNLREAILAFHRDAEPAWDKATLNFIFESLERRNRSV